MRTVPISDLDKFLAYCDEGYAISHDEAYKRFNQIALAPPSDLPNDPFSEEYADIYLNLYKLISNRQSYEIHTERTYFNVDELTLRPFPYYTKSFKLTAEHFSLIGRLLDMMDCSPGSDILEFGFGWGNTTLILAMLGHNVTAVDIEENFCELVRRRSKIAGVDIEIINSDFLWVERTDRKFDAVVFFECFHHCWDFRRLLEALHRVIKPGGKIYFGAEPINDRFSVPWGLRLDGGALFVARRSGWMELGFRNDFFAELLTRTGWRGSNVSEHFWVAVSASEPIKPIVYEGDDPRLATIVGTRVEGGIRIAFDAPPDVSGFALFGPYLRLPAGTYDATVEIEGASGMAGACIDAAAESGSLQLERRIIDVDEAAKGAIRSSFVLANAASAVEVRLQVPGGASGLIRRVTIAERALSTEAGPKTEKCREGQTI